MQSDTAYRFVTMKFIVLVKRKSRESYKVPRELCIVLLQSEAALY